MADNFVWFKARYTWSKSFCMLEDSEIVSLVKAIWRLAETGEEIAVSGKAAFLWPMIADEIKHDRLDRENGSKGGRPKNPGKNPLLNPGKNPPLTDKEKEKEEEQEQEKNNTLMFNDGPSSPIERHQRKMQKDFPGFDAFYSAYPKHQGKADAQKAWNALAPSGELQTVILAAVGRQRDSPEWKKDNGKYIPLPATWLRGRRWEDETALVQASQYADFNLGVTL